MPREAIDPARLRRASLLAVERLGPMQFRVRGQAEAFYDVNMELDVPCTCKDAEFHGRGCKHELIARMLNGDLPLLNMLGEMLLKQEQHREEARVA